MLFVTANEEYVISYSKNVTLFEKRMLFVNVKEGSVINYSRNVILLEKRVLFVNVNKEWDCGTVRVC